jgi:hypothetical protein
LEASAIRAYPIPVAQATSVGEQLAAAGRAAGLLTAGVAQLVHERDVTRDVDDQRSDPDPREHRVH